MEDGDVCVVRAANVQMILEGDQRSLWDQLQDQRVRKYVGFTIDAIEEWRAVGIDPPPLAGDPANPEIVRLIRESRERWAKLSDKQKAERMEDAHAAADDMDRRLGTDTKATKQEG